VRDLLANRECACLAAFAVVCLGGAGAAFVIGRVCCLAVVSAGLDLGLGFGVVNPAADFEF
jgi:hypothetical protein